ncbi:hypothetical protein [Magnetospirillum gryphiswaldense]|uniref:Uncharacterized protein n=1 Tax=Magnetospirillum gryphiswaldense TaxID=55518 RepID=A4TYJ3_9PROT|nr:hypothetical protein [Magnetospirillum gryphiswaldense]CAM75700.1 hypothetical protein MGR_0473 [Magnetospirillum gryphiswaldense MSR-1]
MLVMALSCFLFLFVIYYATFNIRFVRFYFCVFFLKFDAKAAHGGNAYDWAVFPFAAVHRAVHACAHGMAAGG